MQLAAEKNPRRVGGVENEVVQNPAVKMVAVMRVRILGLGFFFFWFFSEKRRNDGGEATEGDVLLQP